MHPELFKIPYLNLPVNTFGLMLVIGFLAAITLIKYLSRDLISDPQIITNGALYVLIAGVVGARAFYVIHHYDKLEGGLVSILAIWRGGLELYGAVILVIPVVFYYLWRHKLPIRKFLDIIFIGLTLVIVFGRIGCFMRGCCYGKPTNLPWAVHFPYASDPYYSQVYPDPKRDRMEPYIQLPDDYFGYYQNSKGESFYGLKPYSDLTDEQKQMVTTGKYRSLAIHPTQLYSSLNGLLLCGILLLFWRRSKRAQESGNINKFLTEPGSTFALAFILYGITRFILETLRDDNPFEIDSLTISQNIGIAMAVAGVILMIIFQKMGSQKATPKA
jgi:phosphatidylglycerol:prolipoprotein diacylglycerol transferase